MAGTNDEVSAAAQEAEDESENITSKFMVRVNHDGEQTPTALKTLTCLTPGIGARRARVPRRIPLEADSISSVDFKGRPHVVVVVSKMTPRAPPFSHPGYIDRACTNAVPRFLWCGSRKMVTSRETFTSAAAPLRRRVPRHHRRPTSHCCQAVAAVDTRPFARGSRARGAATERTRSHKRARGARNGMMPSRRTAGARARSLAQGAGPGNARGQLIKAPAVKNFAWLPVGVNYNKPARGSVSLI